MWSLLRFKCVADNEEEWREGYLLGGSTVVVGLSVLSYVVAELLYSGTPLIWTPLGQKKGALIREVSLFQGCP